MEQNYNGNSLCLQHSGLVESIKVICTKMDEREKLVNNKFDSLEKSVQIARIEMDRRLEGMNEFRAQLEKQTVTFPTRQELNAEIEKINLRSNLNSSAIEGIKQSIAMNAGARKWSDYLVTALVSAAIFAIMHFILRI